ncbi:MAG: serine/threonine-protein phosphatase, partial [Pirellulaceae bacterium]|nr:serine/threonine-protein phosphatase [Pirellulaceae bacterium]
YIDPQTKHFKYASAGHRGWHFSPANGFIELASTGMVLGADEDAKWDLAESPQLQNGDFLMIMTDGISEATSASGEEFGIDRMHDFVRQHADISASELVDQLYDHIKIFTKGTMQQDDITMVIVKVTE